MEVQTHEEHEIGGNGGGKRFTGVVGIYCTYSSIVAHLCLGGSLFVHDLSFRALLGVRVRAHKEGCSMRRKAWYHK